MLQYFMQQKYKHIFAKGFVPKLEYFCKVDEKISSKMPRIMHVHRNLVEVLLVYEGNGIYTIEHNKYIAKKGDLIFYNSGIVHDEFGGYGDNLSTYCLGISNLKLVHLEKDKIIGENYCPVINCYDDFEEILNILEIIQHNIDTNSANIAQYSDYLMQALIVKFCTIIEKNGNLKQMKEPSLATKVKIYIDKNYNENISLEAIAIAVNANEYYLSHIFKAETGFSPMQYVTRRRIGEAQNLLINTKLSITEVSASVGYNNSNYFSNVFRKMVGFTPGDYRKRWQI